MEAQFKKELMELLGKHECEIKSFIKPCWPEQDPEMGLFVEFDKTGNEIHFGSFINSDGSEE